VCPPPSPGEPDRPLSPVRRSYSATSARGDRDSFRDATDLKTGAWSLAGGVLGFIAGFMVGHPLVGAVGGWAACFLAVRGISGAAGAAAGKLHHPSAGTPHPQEHSRAEALAARGHLREAVELLAEAVEGEPASPGPYLRAARILRDELGELEEAAAWFRRALRDAAFLPGRDRLVRRELVELYIHRMKEPRRAAPELARMREESAGTEEGAWAERELEEVKRRMREDVEDVEDG